jgi:hypothetical protein
MSNIKVTRAAGAHRGARPRVLCFDCGEQTGAAMAVYRLIGPEGSEYRGVVFVHRNGAGCHKGMTAHEVRTEGGAR